MSIQIISDKIVNIQSTITNEDDSTGTLPKSIVVTSTDIIPVLSPLAKDTFHLSTSCLYDILRETPTGNCVIDVNFKSLKLERIYRH